MTLIGRATTLLLMACLLVSLSACDLLERGPGPEQIVDRYMRLVLALDFEEASLLLIDATGDGGESAGSQPDLDDDTRAFIAAWFERVDHKIVSSSIDGDEATVTLSVSAPNILALAFSPEVWALAYPLSSQNASAWSDSATDTQLIQQLASRLQSAGVPLVNTMVDVPLTKTKSGWRVRDPQGIGAAILGGMGDGDGGSSTAPSEPTSTATPRPGSRSRPMLIGQTARFTTSDGQGIHLTLTEVAWGEQAKRIQDGGIGSLSYGPGTDMVMVAVRFVAEYVSGDEEESWSINHQWDFSVEVNRVMESPRAEVWGEPLTGTAYPGGRLTGWVAFEVPQGTPSEEVKVCYRPLQEGVELWYSLEGSGAFEASPTGSAGTPLPPPTDTPLPTRASAPNATPTKVATPEPTPTPRPGHARTNPAPLGRTLGYSDDKRIAVADLIRPADARIQSYNRFNPRPSNGQEWIMVPMVYGCDRLPDEVCSFTPFEFRLVGDKGKIYDAPLGVSVPEELEPRRELFGDADPVIAVLAFTIDTDEENLVLIWDPGPGYEVSYFEVRDDTSDPEAESAAVSPAGASTPVEAADRASAPAGVVTPTSGGTPTSHTVQAGDTLSKIAAAYGVSASALASFNGIADPSRIYVGQVIELPPADYTPPTPDAATASDAPAAETSDWSAARTYAVGDSLEGKGYTIKVVEARLEPSVPQEVMLSYNRDEPGPYVIVTLEATSSEDEISTTVINDLSGTRVVDALGHGAGRADVGHTSEKGPINDYLGTPALFRFSAGETIRYGFIFANTQGWHGPLYLTFKPPHYATDIFDGFVDSRVDLQLSVP